MVFHAYFQHFERYKKKIMTTIDLYLKNGFSMKIPFACSLNFKNKFYYIDKQKNVLIFIFHIKKL